MASAEPIAKAGHAPSTTPWVSTMKPRLLRIEELRDETPDVRTLRLKPIDGQPLPKWSAGQFAEWSVFGSGEAVFTLANSPTRGELIECSYRATGKVTFALRNLGVGDTVGFRGPFGNRFPVEDWKGKKVAFVGGGIGTVALRAVMQWVMDNKRDYGDVTILNGARSVTDLCYQSEMPEWQKIPGVKVVRTVDPGGDKEGWDGEVGLIPTVFEKLAIPAAGTVVVACGPPVMLKFLFLALDKLGYTGPQVVTTLENKMKCGIGMCGRCNVGRHYVCVDGPVFTWEQIKSLPNDF